MKKILTILSVFTLVFSLSVTAFASGLLNGSDLPTFIPDNQYIVLHQGTDGSKYTSYRLFTFNGNRYNVKAIANRNSQGTLTGTYGIVFETLDNQNYPTITEYVCNSSGTGWDKITTHNTNGSKTEVLVGNAYRVVGGNVEIVSDTGIQLFPLPPTLQEVVKEEMSNFQVTMAGIMKVLLLCGVGCLISLVVLKVFGKVFRIFQI